MLQPLAFLLQLGGCKESLQQISVLFLNFQFCKKLGSSYNGKYVATPFTVMKIKEIELLSFGSLTTDTEEKELNKNSPTGYFLYPDKIEFIDKTDKLQGVQGLKFGIEYFIKGYNSSMNIDVSFCCRILHPKLTNPMTNEQFSETIETKRHYLNNINFDYLFFEYDWEVKTGIYTFQIIENECILLEKSFEIF